MFQDSNNFSKEKGRAGQHAESYGEHAKNDQAAVTLPGHLLFGVVSCHYKSRIPPLFVSNFGELL